MFAGSSVWLAVSQTGRNVGFSGWDEHQTDMLDINPLLDDDNIQYTVISRELEPNETDFKAVWFIRLPGLF